MTACNAFVTSEVAHVYTDGAWLNPDGTLHHAGGKIIMLPHLRAVIASMGGSHLPALVGPHFDTAFTSFDEMIEGAPAFMREPPEPLKPLVRHLMAAPGHLLLIGYSDQSQAVVGRHMHNMSAPGAPAWEVGAFEVAISPNDPGVLADFGATPRLPSSEEGLSMLRRQRQFVDDIGGGVRARGVGCFAQLTVLTKDRIQSSIVERWPYRLGEPLPA